MNVRWQKLLVKTSFWLATEIVLNLIGIDDLADYSEFLLQDRNNFSSPIVSVEFVTSI